MVSRIDIGIAWALVGEAVNHFMSMSRKLRVLHVIPGVAPRYGGPSVNLWPLVKALNDRPNLVAEIATTDADGPGGKVDQSIVPYGLQCHLFPRIGGEALKRSPELDRWLLSNTKNYDVVHVHSLWNSPSNSAAAAAIKAAVPYIVRPAGMLSPYTWQRGWLKKRLFWLWGVRRTVRNAAAIHVTAASEAVEARASGASCPIFEAPNGLEDQAFELPAKPNWLQEKFKLDHRPVILYLSRLHPKKGITDYLLPAFAKLFQQTAHSKAAQSESAQNQSVQLVIAGGVDDTTPGYGEEIQNKINEYNLQTSVKVVGSIANQDRWYAFDSAAVFCLPSENENFASVVVEAMARGCRVVTTKGVAAGVIAKNYEYGDMVDRDVGQITTSLKQQLNVGRRQVQLAEQQKIRQLLSWPGIAERLNGLYSELIELNSGLNSDLKSQTRNSPA